MSTSVSKTVGSGQATTAAGKGKVDGIVFAQSLVARLDGISEQRKQWEATDYAKANEGLYALLSQCLSVYESEFLTGSDTARKALRAELNDRLTAGGVRVQRNSTTLTMFVRYVFGSDRKRAQGYAYVIAAAVSHKVSAEAMPDWIRSSGGVEEIKRLAVKSAEALARQQTLQAARESVSAELALAEQTPLAQVSLAGVTGDYAVLLVRPGLDGQLSVVGTLSNANESVVKVLLQHMARHRVLSDAETKLVTNEAQSLLAAALIESSNAVFAQAA